MRKYFSSLTILTFLLFTALVNAQDKDETKYYYIGKIGDEQALQMELSLEDAELRGSYYNDKTGIPLPLSGEVDTNDSKISLYTKSGNRKFNGEFSPINGGLGTYIEGAYSEQDGSIKIPFKLTKVANYEFILIKQGANVETAWSYPKLISKNEVIQKISPKIRDRMKPEIEEFQKNAKEGFMADAISHGWQFNYNYTIEYYSEKLISFTGQVYSYTGGAHGNTYYVSSNYWISDGESKLLKLSELFKKDSDYLKVLSDYCINDLRKRGAGWVVSGDIKSFKEDEIGPFALSPRGIQFAFAPYAVGSYAEGAYFVTIDYGHLQKVINPEGPLSQFVGPSKAESQIEE